MISKPQPSPRPLPGSMTTVMRAASRPRGERVLRAALVRAGRVVDERILADGPLTVGPSEHNTFVVPLAESVRLVERVGGRFRLRGAPGAQGRVVSGGEVHDLERLARGAAVDLADDARGKIALGDGIVLFQIADPPVRPPRAQLPIAVRKGAFDGLDWKTTFIAAFSFLFHFGAVGAVYSDWADPEVDDAGRVAVAVGILKEITAPPPLQPIQMPTEGETSTPKPAEARTVPGPSAGAPGAGRGGPARGSGQGGSGRVSNERAAEIARALEDSDAAMVLAVGARSNGAVARVLASGDDVSLGMLNAIASAPGGVRVGDVSGLNLGSRGGVVRPGEGGARGLPVAVEQGPSKANEMGNQVAVKKPVPSAQVSPPDVSGGSVPDAGRVVGGLRGALRQCYRRGLDEDPMMRGSARAVLSIGAGGEVRSVQMSGSGLSANMMGCLKRVVSSAQFGPPEGGGATVVIPMGFLPQ